MNEFELFGVAPLCCLKDAQGFANEAGGFCGVGVGVVDDLVLCAWLFLEAFLVLWVCRYVGDLQGAEVCGGDVVCGSDHEPCQEGSFSYGYRHDFPA